MKIKWTFLCYFLFTLTAFAQTDDQRPFEFKIVSDYTGLYTVYWKPNIDMETYIIGAGQIAFSAPLGSFEPTDLVSYNGVWNERIDIVYEPEIVKNRDYFYINLQDVGNLPAVKKEDEIVLVTFRNAKGNCPGKIELVDEEDPLVLYYESIVNACINCTTININPRNDLAIYDIKAERVYNVGGVYDKGNAGCANLFTTETYELNTDPFTVFPNPANDFMMIQLEELPKEDVEIQLMDISGKILESLIMRRGTKSASLDISKFNQGMYIIHVNDNNYVETKRVMVLRN